MCSVVQESQTRNGEKRKRDLDFSFVFLFGGKNHTESSQNFFIFGRFEIEIVAFFFLFG